MGVKLTDTISQIMKLLKIPSEEYIAKSSSVASPKVAAVIAKIRNIK